MKGFKISETMTGTHAFTSTNRKELPLYFKIDWSCEDTIRCLKTLVSMKPLSFQVRGKFFAEGLCDEVVCNGSMSLDYFNSHTISYYFDFNTKSGPYFFVGEKINIKPWNLLTSHTTCYGTIMDPKGRLVSRCKVFFDLKTLPAMLYSFSWYNGC